MSALLPRFRKDAALESGLVRLREKCPSGKTRHPSESKALEALARVRAERAMVEDPELVVPENRIYPCDRCDGWHLTSRDLHPEDLTPVKDRVASETWEMYARRLEKRIAQQRAEIMSLHLLGHGAMNRAGRRRIESLVIALGRMTERWENERRNREALVAALAVERRGDRRFRFRWLTSATEPATRATPKEEANGAAVCSGGERL